MRTRELVRVSRSALLGLAAVLVAGSAGGGCDCDGTYRTRMIAEMTVSPDQVAADGQATARIEVLVFLDSPDRPALPGVEVEIRSARNAGDAVDTISQPDAPTDADGLAVAAVASSTDGSAELAAFAGGQPLCASIAEGECLPLVATVTFVGQCEGDQIFCDGACTDPDTDPDHCGDCQTACSYPNAAGTCEAGVCAMGACDDGFDDCNTDPADGCEISLLTDPANCGSCDNDCGAEPCNAGWCGSACGDADEDGFDDAACGGTDCDDGRPEVNPDATEVCDGRDDDCDGQTDEEPEAGASCADGDACTQDVCQAGACQNPPAADGTACDDGLGCTSDDACSGGACQGTPLDCSGLDGPCAVGVCNEATLQCEAQALSDGTLCSNGLFCVVNERCAAGACIGGEPRDCSAAGGGCRDGACDEAQDQCVGDPLPGGTPCNDGLFCTVNDACDGLGECSGTARDCSGLDSQCAQGTCDDIADQCQPSPINEGQPCDDGLHCNENEVCLSGACAGGNALDCSDGDACTADSCDEANDTCSNVLVPNPGAEGPPLDPSCSNGVDDDCDLNTDIDDPDCQDCVGNGDCDDGNPCTVNTCVGNICQTANQPDGTGCDDGQYCTTPDTCSAGVCGGPARDCSGLDDDCNQGICNEASDACVAQNINQGGLCDDGLFCVVDTTCDAGVCQGGSTRDCSAAADQCNNGICDEANDACAPQPAFDGQPCDDGLYCNTGETCQAGACQGGGARDCSGAADQCNAGVCDEGAGACVSQPLGPGTSCEDGLFCTGGDTCDGNGSCSGGAAVVCGTPCQTVCNEAGDACDPDSNGTPCDDGLFCTATDACDGGGNCTGSGDPCSGGDACNDTCNEGSGDCFSPLGTGCDDGLFCTATDTCDGGGGCSGSGDPCTGGDACNDTCNEGSGNCFSGAGTPCDDGLFCTVTDNCDGGGNCTGSGDPCSGGDACNDTCNEGSGDCFSSLGTGCDDGLFCTATDTCDGFGACSGAGDPCAPLGCDEGNDVCEVCVPDQPYCDADGRTLHTCLPDGSGPNPALDVVCGYICEAAACVAATNVSDAEMGACDGAAPPLVPAAGDTVTFTSNGIECSTDCGDGSTLIPSVDGPTPADPVRVCVSDLDLDGSITIVPDGSEARGLILLVDGNAVLAGGIDFSGADGTDGTGSGLAGGAAGPGGFAGADGCGANACDGLPGFGAGGGGGGLRIGNQAGAGGGAGYGGLGGDGGDGNGDGDGGTGGSTYPAAAPWLVPLVGGSGGGSGGDGQGGGGSGPGGGGGGALQITARGDIDVSGTLSAIGGQGGEPGGNHGAGGGGSGGGVFLEARSVSLTGAVLVDGGPGGDNSGCGITGGAGASGADLDGSVGDDGPGCGGAGGGGGGGRVRVRSVDGSACATVSPAGSCTADAM